MTSLRTAFTLFLALAAACSDGATDPPGGPGGGTGEDTIPVPEAGLRFLRPAVTAPPLGERQVQFWAVRGERREVRLMYTLAPGATDSVEFARFRVDDRTLVTGPGGVPLAQGDSVLISITVVDTLRLITEFQPAGLVFNPSRPARLWLKYGEADPDLDRDGQVTAADTALVAALRIYRQEQPGDPWFLVPSVVRYAELEVEANIPGFTRYAVAY